MVGFKDERFEYVFDMMCKKTVELNRIDREISIYTSLIDGFKTNMELNQDKVCIIKSLEIFKSTLINLKPKRNIINNDYQYYNCLFMRSLENKAEEDIKSSILVFSDIEHQLAIQISHLKAKNGNNIEIEELQELHDVYYKNIEFLYEYIDSKNDVRNRHKIPR